MVKLRRVAITIGLMLATVSAVHSQDASASRQPHVRSLSSFESIYVPDIADQESDVRSETRPSRLTREFRDRLILQAQSRTPVSRPLPFYWNLVDSIGSTTARTLVATVKPDSAGIVIEFADTFGISIAAVHSSTITEAMGVLYELSRRTVEYPGRFRASQPVWAYPTMHLSYQNPVGRNDEFNLLPRLTAALRERGRWNLVDTLPAEGDVRRAQTVQCFMWHVRSLPTSVSLRCSVPLVGAPVGSLLPWDPSRAEHVLFITGASCKGCIGTDFVFTSTKTRAIAATDDLARDLLKHVELEQRIYSPQRGDNPR